MRAVRVDGPEKDAYARQCAGATGGLVLTFGGSGHVSNKKASVSRGWVGRRLMHRATSGSPSRVVALCCARGVFVRSAPKWVQGARGWPSHIFRLPSGPICSPSSIRDLCNPPGDERPPHGGAPTSAAHPAATGSYRRESPVCCAECYRPTSGDGGRGEPCGDHQCARRRACRHLQPGTNAVLGRRIQAASSPYAACRGVMA